MLIKAVVGFSGVVSMRKGEALELDGAILDDLLRAGYVTPAEDVRAKARTRKRGGENAKCDNAGGN